MRDDRVMALHNEILWRDNEIKTKLQRENETVCPIRFVIRAVQPFRRDDLSISSQCERKLIEALKEEPQRLRPGKIKAILQIWSLRLE